jgi:hypothetical protein
MVSTGSGDVVHDVEKEHKLAIGDLELVLTVTATECELVFDIRQ